MSLLVLSNVVSSRPLPGDGTAPPIPGDAIPMPMPIAPGEPAPDGGRIRMVAGTEAGETLVIEGGATAFGGGGDDTFVLVSSGDSEGSERLGAILDFNAGDALDLSRLGANARVLGREALDGGERVSIDYDGDGQGGRLRPHLRAGFHRPRAGRRRRHHPAVPAARRPGRRHR